MPLRKHVGAAAPLSGYRVPNPTPSLASTTACWKRPAEEMGPQMGPQMGPHTRTYTTRCDAGYQSINYWICGLRCTACLRTCCDGCCPCNLLTGARVKMQQSTGNALALLQLVNLSSQSADDLREGGPPRVAGFLREPRVPDWSRPVLSSSAREQILIAMLPWLAAWGMELADCRWGCPLRSSRSTPYRTPQSAPWRQWKTR